jgi:hypothetical protein
MQPPDPDFLCCELSAEMNEPMMGTAVTAAVWFMLEYTRPWGAQATEENELPDEVMRWLGDEVRKWDGRLQFIRQFRPDNDVLTIFVGVNEETEPRLYEFHLGAYADLLELDIAAIVAGEARFDPHLVTEPRYFVCTNGKRDKSCAIYGAALYRALAEKVGAAVWMTTHLGGHRFAPTLLTLPHGVCYGRVSPTDISHLLTAAQRSELWLEGLRGRSCYGAVEQVADFYARQETGQRQLDALRWLETAAHNDRWQVQFVTPAQQIVYVTLTAARPLTVYANSGQLKTKEMAQYQLDKVTR